MGTNPTPEPDAPHTSPEPGRRRFTRAERREMIIDGAVNFFSEHGFGASTHQLAESLGITQPLIYSYFPSKEDLFEAVYERVFTGRWKEEWDTILEDRSVPLRTRLERFYVRYGDVIQSTEWMRIYLYSGLKSLDMNRRYIAIVDERIIKRICREVRHEFGLPSEQDAPITAREIEAVWTLHGGIFYYGLRRHVYEVPVADSFENAAIGAIDTFLRGMPAMVTTLLSKETEDDDVGPTGKSEEPDT